MSSKINFSSIKPVLRAGSVKFAGVFGSVARKEAKLSSDVDILVKFSKPVSLLDLIRLENLISKKIGRKVDLVTEESLNPLIKNNVLRDLKPIYEKR